MKSVNKAREAIVADIIEERERQDSIWGRQAGFWDDHDMVKLTVVTEEVGEIAQAILKEDHDNLKVEIIQTMAVLMAWAETIEMNEPSDDVIMEEGPSVDEDTIENLEKKVAKLSAKLSQKIKDKRSACSHIFSNPRYSNDDNGWDYEYNYYTDYSCELCKLSLREKAGYSRTGVNSGRRDIEMESWGKVWLKIVNNKVIVFDPIMKTFLKRSEYGDHKVESLIVPGLKTRLEELGVWDTEERIEKKDEK